MLVYLWLILIISLKRREKRLLMKSGHQWAKKKRMQKLKQNSCNSTKSNTKLYIRLQRRMSFRDCSRLEIYLPKLLTISWLPILNSKMQKGMRHAWTSCIHCVKSTGSYSSLTKRTAVVASVQEKYQWSHKVSIRFLLRLLKRNVSFSLLLLQNDLKVS